MPNIMDIAKDRGILVIEDVAQAIGVEIEGKKAGSYGDISVYSFHAQKNITSLGEGGMIGFTDDRYAEILPMIRHNGHCDFASPRADYWLPAMGNVDLPELEGNRIWPNNYCLSEIPCALANRLLDRIETINNEKRARAIRFIDRFSEYPELVFHRENSSRHNYHLLAACLLNGQRDEFIRKMSVVYGIQCAVQYYPLNRYPFYERLGYGVANCPNTDRFFDNMISFPFYHSLDDEQFEKVIVAGLSILDESRNT
jgi:dTDP-4-amino-4,6-dideoxygalactose transaminase